MKNKYLLVILTLVLAVGLMGIPTAKAAYTLVWSDEFDGSSVNLNNWTFETGGHGWGNNELQYYTNGLNATVSGGILTITARRENYENRQYTSTRMITRGKREFRYGRIEARIQIPTGKGLWPAFWTLGANFGSVGWPRCGEIDIMEHVNTETRTHGYIHWDAGSGHASYGGTANVSNPTAWHVYAIEWDASGIRWSVDGVTFVEANILNNINGTEEFHLPHFMLLNLAVGGDWPGSPDASTVFPAYYRVDYVRVYQDNGTPTTPVPTATPTPPPSTTSPIPGHLEAENYSAKSGIDTESCSEGGLNVGWIESGDWMDYNVNVQSSGTYNAQYRVASTGTSGRFDLRRGSTVLGSYTVPNTGGWQSWTTVSGNVSLSSGAQTLRIYATGSSWNINWFRFTTGGGATPTPTPGSTLPSTTWYLFNQSVSGVSPAGQNLQASNSSVTGWQPTRTITTTPAYWYSPTINGTYKAGTYSFYLWTNNPGSSSQVRVELFKVNSDGSSATLIASQTNEAGTSGGGNHATTYTFTGIGAVGFSNQRLLIRITKVSGADLTMAYNTNDFPTRLVTP